ncbi:MAG: RNA ligase, Rnl2 family [bacterium]|nr:RNA ligase, Rnl2 family [bacterium]
MQHMKYTSIENTYRDKFIEMIKEEGKDTGEWVVMEKVHGGQFSLYYDGNEMQASSRTMFLTPETDFFNYEEVMKANASKVTEIYNSLKKEKPDLAVITVYGELFGGSYPHKDVLKVKGAKRLQKGVFYHPGNLFYAFDIRVDGSYLPVDECNGLFESVDMFYAKPLLRGTMEECLNYPNTFLSKISQWLGLPEIEDNIAEGVVIKPVNPGYLKVGERIIMKSKNEKFKERKSVKKRPPKQVVPLSPEAERLLQEMEAMVTENRLRNVLSKRGELPYPVPKNLFGEIMKAFNDDVMEEFNKDFEQDYDQLDSKEQKKIAKNINLSSAKLVRTLLFSDQKG